MAEREMTNSQKAGNSLTCKNLGEKQPSTCIEIAVVWAADYMGSIVAWVVDCKGSTVRRGAFFWL
jgi:hypothetical protein